MIKMLRFRVLALLFVVCAFGAPKSFADHISSADMYVDYIGNGPNDLRYRVTAVFYRICIGNNLALDTLEGGFSVRSQKAGTALNLPNNQAWTRTLRMYNPNIQDTVDNLCPAFSAINSCRVAANTHLSGYTRRVYTDTVTLPSRQDDYYFTWGSCCRLQSYANIAQSGPSFYLETKMNIKARYNNSTPRYNSLPFVFCCENQPSSLSNLPSDPDGDSISTLSQVPMQTATTLVNFNPGFNAAVPTGITGYYNVATTTGRANFLPTAPGKMALGFRTYDFDPITKDTLSWVSRDLTITVLPCTNLPPYIDSIPQSLTGVRRIDTTGGEVVMTVCSQSELDFDINARSNNAGGLIYMYPASRLPSGMSMTPTLTGGTGIAKLKWRPTAAQVGRYTISLLAVDSTCAVGQEITLRNEFTFTVIVRAALDAGPDLRICPLGDRPVQLGTNAPATNNFTWTNDAGGTAEFLDCTDCPDPSARPDRDYYYVVTIDNPDYDCKLSDTVGVLIDNSVRITAPQDSLLVCRPSIVGLQSIVTGPAPQQNIQCGVNNPIACNPADEETATVGAGLFGPLGESNTPFFSRQQFVKYQYIIPKRQLLDAGLYGGTINQISFQTIEAAILGANPLANFTISLGCVDQERYSTTPSNTSFLTAVTPVVTVNSLTLTPNAWNDIAFTTPYSWDTSKNLVVDICVGPMTTLNQNGIDPVAMAPGHAIQKFSNTINVCGGNAPSVQYYSQRPVTRFKYCPSPSLPFQFSWQPGDLLDDSTIQNPQAYIERSRQFMVYTVGRNNCLIRDTLNVILPEHRLSNGPQDTFICQNQPAYLRASGGDAYSWFEFNNGVFSDASGSLNCTDCANPIATPQQTTQYAVVFTNDVNRGNPENPSAITGCPDTMYLKINVWPLPSVYSPNADTMIKYGERVQLFARGASRYLWTPITGVTDPNSPAPFVAPQNTTNYVVTGTDSNGCTGRDTVTISIDYQVNQLVPTAFTPNNDGLNDVFKIVNPSFYRLMEFRVFNRWGQEVFTTTDINRGWDGKWKGVDQQMGSFNYLIRVGSPDGNVMSYKGDVTLIR